MLASRTRKVLTALALPKVGPATVRKAMANAHALDNPEAALDAIISRHQDEAVRLAAASADSTIERCTALGIWIATCLDSWYSRRLLEIPDYPVMLYGIGNAELLSSNCIAVVGTRHPSDLGLVYASRIAEALVEAGVTVVSGLALGIDTAAHKGALKANGNTIAVLAHGLDSVSPSSNRPLADAIVDSNGALLSEHPPGVPAYPPEFVRRNRIQSGISLASIMVESGETGGSIHQAQFTRSQGRELLAVVPRPELIEKYGFKVGGADVIQQRFAAARIESREDVVALARRLVSGHPA